jgi:hypothetical protein
MEMIFKKGRNFIVTREQQKASASIMYIPRRVKTAKKAYGYTMIINVKHEDEKKFTIEIVTLTVTYK